MESLSDDVLLSVFAWLGMKDLLRIRGVCLRWRALAVHSYLWQRMSLHDLSVGSKFCEAVLRVAPCLDRLSLNLDHPFPLVVTTSCAAKRLSFSVWDDRATMTARVLQRQLQLGRLRELRIHLHGDYSLFAGLMEEIGSAQNLLKLTMQNYKPPIGGMVRTTTVPSSLEELHWDAPIMDRHLQVLLFSHRRTLKVLSVPHCLSLPMRIVRQLEQLRRLECPPQKDFKELAHCPKLSALSVRMVPGYRVGEKDVPAMLEDLAGTVSFLSEATQLKEFKLHPEETVKGKNFMRRLLLAPTKLGDSTLEEVELAVGSPIAVPQQTLAEALPHMPVLRRITLSCRASLELLSAIAPRNVPRLRELHMVLDCCAHQYIHRPEVKRLLERNAQLHLLVRDNSHCHHSSPCGPCRLPCHAVLADPARSPNVGVFTHAEHVACSVDVHQKRHSVFLWLRL